MPTETLAERREQARDLRDQIAELDRSDMPEIQFQDISPGRRKETLYSTLNGEPISVPRYMVDGILAKRLPDGRFAFVGAKENAPEYKKGDVKCFLHPESVERQAGLLAAAGIAHMTCFSAFHPSRYAMEEIAQSKHKKQWAAFKSYLAEEERKEERQRQQNQIDATLALAGKAAGMISATVQCPDCGQQSPSDHANPEGWLRGHKMGAHKDEVKGGDPNANT